MPVKFSNKVNIWIRNHGSGVKNGGFFSYNKEKQKTEVSTRYDFDSSLIEAYKNYDQIFDYMQNYIIYSNNREYSKSIWLPNPSGPGLVY